MSDRAKAFLKELLPQRPEPEQVFRLARAGSGFALRFDEPKEDDMVFEHEDEQILAVSLELMDRLDGTIDREDSTDGPRLVLVR
jgi:hypothetical protein